MNLKFCWQAHINEQIINKYNAKKPKIHPALGKEDKFFR
jgi:hypothetical protein